MQKLTLILGLLCFSLLPTFSQNLLDGFQINKGSLDIALSTTVEQYDHLFVGTEKVDVSNTLGTVTNTSLGLYAQYGITDRLSAIVTLPFIQSKAKSPSQTRDMTNLQDLSIHAKYAVVRANENRPITLNASLGVIFPIGNYDPLVPVTIGSHAVCTQLGLASQYRWSNGLFAEASTNFTIKGEEVPNALQGTVKFGWSSNRFYTHVWYQEQKSFGGTNLREEGSTFQTMNVSFNKIGVLLSYRVLPMLNMFAGGGQIISGRNTGHAFFASLGVSTNLSLKK